MSNTVTATDVARHFADYLNRVAFRRESFVIVRGKKRLAEIRPVPQGRCLGDLPSVIASLPHLSPEDADQFARDVDEARDSLGRLEASDPWER